MRKWAAVVMAFLLTVAVGWIAFDDLFAPMDNTGQVVEIPDFSVYAADEAPEWAEIKTEYRHDDAPTGTLLSQSPSAGSRRKLTPQSPRCEITLTVSLGVQHIALPSVVGLDAREAEGKLRELGLTVKTQTAPSVDAAGTVFAMEPLAGTELPLGECVLLSVSEGTPQKSVTVPDLRGLSRSEALVRLWCAELTLDRVVEENPDDPSGTVSRQSHLPGTLVPAGTAVIIYIG